MEALQLLHDGARTSLWGVVAPGRHLPVRGHHNVRVEPACMLHSHLYKEQFYNRIGSNRGNPDSTIMHCTENIHTAFESVQRAIPNGAVSLHCSRRVHGSAVPPFATTVSVKPRCIEEFIIALSIFKVSAPKNQRVCPSMANRLLRAHILPVRAASWKPPRDSHIQHLLHNNNIDEASEDNGPGTQS